MDTERSQVMNLGQKSLEIWLQETDIKLTQVNGQRKYGGPPDDWCGAPPGPGCEVFISQIPRDTYEDQLIPLFRAVGPLWEFRLMMNFSGQNRGFAYAKYGSPASAAAAIRTLHGHVLKLGVHLSVRRSTEKRQLCLGDLPANTGRERLQQVLRDLSDGVEGVSLKLGPGGEGVAAVVVYTSHHAASMAKKVLVEAFKKHFRVPITVKWQSSARPKSDERPRPPNHFQSPVKPPCRILESPRPPLLPPRLVRHQLPAFSRAVGPPTPRVPLSPPRGPAMAQDAVALLQSVCEVYGGGPPLYDIRFRQMGPDGFLCFGYRVCVPGLEMPFTGTVQTLPGPSQTAVQEEAQKATADKVLRALYMA